MAKYKLTASAELDLLNIAVYGMEQFGLAQAELYRDKLQRRFDELATSPLHYPAVDFIREGYRRSVCGSHSIYYRIQPDFVEIMRVIGKEDF